MLASAPVASAQWTNSLKPTGDVKGGFFDRAELIPIDAYKPKQSPP
jgi:hypothetical protein